MESKPEFRKVTRTEDGGQLIRIPKTFARGLGIDGDVLKMFCADGRLVIEKVEGCVEIYGMGHQNHLVCRSRSNLNPWEHECLIYPVVTVFGCFFDPLSIEYFKRH